jgi:hypothetical protein
VAEQSGKKPAKRHTTKTKTAQSPEEAAGAAYIEQANRLSGILAGQNMVIFVLLLKLIEKGAFTPGDAFAIIDDCLKTMKDDEQKTVPKFLEEALRKSFVPPPGTH